MEQPAPTAEPFGTTTIEVATATVRRAGAAIRLSARERELAVAIAVQTRPIATDALARMLYPDRDGEEVRSAIKVYVYRLRQRAGPDFILSRGGEYTIGQNVCVDVVHGRLLLGELARRPHAFDAAERDRIALLARGLRSEPTAALSDAEWFEPVAGCARRVGRDLAILLGRTALEQGSIRDAVRLAQELTYEDPCDEEAWELLLRAHVLLGEHLAAVQGFRLYEATLAKELATAPSRHIRILVADERDHHLRAAALAR
jgi:DNA-binding SARP family transcriptional activator